MSWLCFDAEVTNGSLTGMITYNYALEFASALNSITTSQLLLGRGDHHWRSGLCQAPTLRHPPHSIIITTRTGTPVVEPSLTLGSLATCNAMSFFINTPERRLNFRTTVLATEHIRRGCMIIV
jgi:hypothetical protein